MPRRNSQPGISSRHEWFGHAHKPRTANRKHHAQRSANRVGGMNTRSTMRSVGFDRVSLRAVYGSSDYATGDHGSDPICRVRDNDEGLSRTPKPYSGPVYEKNIGRYTPLDVIDTTPPKPYVPTPDEITFWLKRALARNMTLVEYAREVLNLKLAV